MTDRSDRDREGLLIIARAIRTLADAIAERPDARAREAAARAKALVEAAFPSTDTDTRTT